MFAGTPSHASAPPYSAPDPSPAAFGATLFL